MERYSRQVRLPAVGPEGQARIAEAHAIVLGVGALGCAAADLLARAGVGTLTLVDRDVVELSNLQRQCLFDERDAAEGIPKAEAARRRLWAVNSSIRIQAQVVDVTARSIHRLMGELGGEGSGGAGDGGVRRIIVDGTDNFETRYLLNDLAVKYSVPYAYAGVVGTAGTVMTVVPERGPCLRCMGEAPPLGTVPTCDAAGVLGAAVQAAASIQVAEVLQLILEGPAFKPRLTSFDLWPGAAGGPRWRVIDGAGLRFDHDCPCCGRRQFEFLDAAPFEGTQALCGQNAVQVAPARPGDVDLVALAERLGAVGSVTVNAFLLRVTVAKPGFEGGKAELTVFRDGRAIVRGTGEPAAARSVYAQYVGG